MNYELLERVSKLAVFRVTNKLPLLALSCFVLSGCQMTKNYTPEGINDSSPKIKISWASYATNNTYYVIKNPCGEKSKELLAHARPKGMFDSGEEFTEVKVKEGEPLTIRVDFSKIKLDLSGVATAYGHDTHYFRFTPKANEVYKLYSRKKESTLLSLISERKDESFELLKSSCPTT